MTTTEPRPGGSAPSKKKAASVSQSGPASSFKEAVASMGDIMKFSGGIVRDFPAVRKYSSEVIHQAGILILTSGLIIWAMQAVMGTVCGLEASYSLKQIGAPIYSGVFNAYCSLREMAPFMWGYIFSAKVGCGLVAELGSMRISEEIDAMEVMGVSAKTYLIGTRVIAAWIAIPFLYTVGLGIMYCTAYWMTVVNLANVSSGGYLYIFWLYQNPLDFLYSQIKVMVMGTVIVFVGCYYGYTASGGSVGVGKNTAKSMMLNMVLVHIVGLLGTQIFWGATPNAPISN